MEVGDEFTLARITGTPPQAYVPHIFHAFIHMFRSVHGSHRWHRRRRRGGRQKRRRHSTSEFGPPGA